jgi:MoaA/NifB/PqqE/SkfB family radical SAM enzyme
MDDFKRPFIFFKKLIKKEINYVSVAPSQALFFMTYRCTSRCKMCTIWRRGEKVDAQKELSLKDWKKCVDMLSLKNIEVIEIFGGDSLLRKDVTIPLIEYIKKSNKNIIVDLPTNCNLLDKETAIALVKAGVDRLYISLDGPIEIHDKIRGNRGTYTNVQKALEYLVEAKKDLGSKTPAIIINCTISSNNVDNFENIISIVKKLGADGVEFEYVGEFKEENIQNTILDGIKPTPFYITRGSSNLLSREQAYLLKKKMKNVRELAKNLKINISTQVIDSLTIDNLTDGTIPNKKCFISRYLVTIDPFGNVMVCFHCNNYILGNIKNVNFSSIRKNKKYRSFLKLQKKGKIKICENCISGVNRNSDLYQSIYRNAYFRFKGKGFDEP